MRLVGLRPEPPYGLEIDEPAAGRRRSDPFAAARKPEPRELSRDLSRYDHMVGDSRYRAGQ
jgi:hypothetical protein